MTQQLTGFVTPITEPLSLIQGHSTQLSLSLQTMNAKLQSQFDSLIAGMGDTSFQGLGAAAFNATIEYYLGIANQHSTMLEQTSTTIQTCSMQLLNAVDTANASYPNAIIVNYVLSQVTLNQVVEQGSSPVEIVLQEMRQTLNNMAKQAQNYGNDMTKAGQSFGQAFSDFFHGNFGAAGHDFQQSWSDFAQSWSDLGQFMLDTGEYLWESVFEMTATVLIQCAEEIWQAVKNCASAFSDLMAKAVQDIQGLTATVSKIVQDDRTLLDDAQNGNRAGAITILLNETINPELQAMGLQQISAGQFEQILKEQAPGLWQWLQSLPWYVWVIAIAVITAVFVGSFVVRMLLIQKDLSARGITANNGQIWSLLWQGYSKQNIAYILSVAGVQASQGQSFTRRTRRGSYAAYGHGMNHVGTSDAAMYAAVTSRTKPTETTFPDQATAQKAANYAIAHNPRLQNFIDTGAPNTEAWATVDLPASLGRNCYGYTYDPTLPPPHVRKIGPPLKKVRIGLFKDASGRVYIFDIFPTQ